jgi:hypothetical protein
MLRSHSHEVLEVCTGEAGQSTVRRGLVQRQCCRRGGNPSSPAAARDGRCVQKPQKKET